MEEDSKKDSNGKFMDRAGRDLSVVPDGFSICISDFEYSCERIDRNNRGIYE